MSPAQPPQRTHRYHPILRATAEWAAMVKTEREKATAPEAERAERDRERKREATYHEQAWARAHQQKGTT